MKILHVYKTFLSDTFGGVAQVIAQIACHPKSSCEHTVLSLSQNPIPSVMDFSGCKNIRYKENFNLASNGISFSLIRDFRKIVAEADLIHYQFPWPFADMLHLFWQIKKPSVVTYQSDILRQKNLLQFYRPIMKRFLTSVDKIVATSPNYLATSEVLQDYRDKIAIIPNGINKDSYAKPSNERLAYWQNLYGKQFFLFVGVMRYYKGLDILLDAAVNTSFPILIVGTGPIEEELKAKAKKLKLTNIHFLGELNEEDKVALLQLALAIIFPSHLRTEAFGMTLLEGAMFGKPLISAEIGTGTTYINIDQETGIVVPPNDPPALRNAMQDLWDNPAKREAMGARAAARYWELFTADRMVMEYEKLYRTVAGK
ncbi:MAG: glycosyltransferase [Tatlockia sp.]|nr:glycosyltransferase [Tatlockia sp.]